MLVSSLSPLLLRSKCDRIFIDLTTIFFQELDRYRSWNKGYNLVDDNKKEYSLGRQTVAYDPGAKSLTVYGGGYRFYPDGTVERLDSRYEITDLSEPAFYKLTDRKYLMTGSGITDNTGKPSDRRLGIYGGRPLWKCPCDERPS